MDRDSTDTTDGAVPRSFAPDPSDPVRLRRYALLVVSVLLFSLIVATALGPAL